MKSTLGFLKKVLAIILPLIPATRKDWDFGLIIIFLFNGVKNISWHNYQGAIESQPLIGIGSACVNDIVLIFFWDWVFANDDVGMGFQFRKMNLLYFSLF